jgi:BspA type Leucine rich repeat region (6 copies)
MLQTVRNIVLLCLQPLAFSLCLLSAHAQFDYTTNNGAITITSYRSGPGGAVTIPDSINGLPVTSIGDAAFSAFYNARLHNYPFSVVIPSSVTNIGSGAFASTSLTSVTIPASVTLLGEGVFQGCSNLTSVYCLGDAPDLVFGVSHGAYVFDGTPATIYYLPGTRYWYSDLSGHPTVLWNPHMQTVRTNGFGFTITGNSNLAVVVEASTNMSAWSRLQTNTLTGLVYFNEPQWTNYPARFYRLRWP